MLVFLLKPKRALRRYAASTVPEIIEDLGRTDKVLDSNVDWVYG